MCLGIWMVEGDVYLQERICGRYGRFSSFACLVFIFFFFRVLYHGTYLFEYLFFLPIKRKSRKISHTKQSGEKKEISFLFSLSKSFTFSILLFLLPKIKLKRVIIILLTTYLVHKITPNPKHPPPQQAPRENPDLTNNKNKNKNKQKRVSSHLLLPTSRLNTSPLPCASPSQSQYPLPPPHPTLSKTPPPKKAHTPTLQSSLPSPPSPRRPRLILNNSSKQTPP